VIAQRSPGVWRPISFGPMAGVHIGFDGGTPEPRAPRRAARLASERSARHPFEAGTKGRAADKPPAKPLAGPSARPEPGRRLVEAIFVPGDPPRSGALALWALPGAAPGGLDAVLGGWAPPGRHGELGVVLRAGSTVRRRIVDARLVAVGDALVWLVGLTPDAGVSASLAGWATAAKLGTGLVARGRLLPAASADGWDAWRVGPLDPEDHRQLAALADAFEPHAHALALAPSTPSAPAPHPAPAPTEGQRPAASRGPLRIPSAGALVVDLWDAMADTLVRSPAAARVVARPAFAALEPTAVGELSDWLAVADRALDAGARAGLRVELPDGGEGEFCVHLQLRSAADPSLVVDAADLWDAPGVVLARLGETADADLLVALRRGARVWAPLQRALDEQRPSSLVLADDEAAELLGPVAEDLAGAGIEVLWPTELTGDELALRAVVRSTPAPGADTSGVLGLSQILEFRWEVALGGQALTAEEMATLAEAKRPLVRLRGRWVTVDPALVERLRRRRGRTLSVGEALAAALVGEVEVDGERATFRAEGPLAALADRLRRLGATNGAPDARGVHGAPDGTGVAGATSVAPDPAGAPQAPEGLVATLRPYQLRGLAWLTEMCELGVGGCLADDMGLGKTVQVIALHLALHLAAPGRGPTLVVCPASLLGNWERELHRFAPAVAVRRFHGGGRHLGDLAPDEVVLVTYGVVRRDRPALAALAWGLMVADEAQHAKNPLSRTARELRAIPTGARVALTGTPVENRLTDLWSILDWTTPGILGPLETFRRQVAVPVERYADSEVTERLARIVRPFLLRRRKTDPGVAPELPAKTETDVVVPLTPEQATLYEAVVREAMASIGEARGMARRGLVLKLLTALKQVCNHPAQYLHQRAPLEGRSGKLAALDELLDVIVAAGDSTLVFSQYVQMGQLLAAHLGARGIEPLFLHGSVPVGRRDEMVARFQAGEAQVLILSLKAGGTGLNLTRATHVVHYDRWWNPAVEDQASDRAYRIGQDRAVQVHRLVTEGTLEDRIAAMLVSKRDLAERVVGAGEGWISELSDAELADLVSLQGGT